MVDQQPEELDPQDKADDIDPADLPEVSQDEAEKQVDEAVDEPPKEPIQDPEPDA